MQSIFHITQRHHDNFAAQARRDAENGRASRAASIRITSLRETYERAYRDATISREHGERVAARREFNGVRETA